MSGEEIGNKDLYIEIVRLQAKIEILADHETRLRGLERWRYSLPLTALGSIAAATMSAIALFHHGG